MTTPSSDTSLDLPCHLCGYDLRAHPPDGKCPECGSSVAESRRLAAIPLRPSWRDCDPRWRRHLLAGVWILLLLPLMDTLQAFHCDSALSVPNLFKIGGPATLKHTLLSDTSVYQPLIFCIGVVLLFSKERNRRPNRLDRTRPWGILCTYVTLLLSAVPVLFRIALVLTGIAALCLDIPLKLQPHSTPLFVALGTTWLRYGPHPRDFTYATLAISASSSITILLACIPLFDALRRSGSGRAAGILLAPLPFFALIHLAQAVWFGLTFSNAAWENVANYKLYFYPQLFGRGIASLSFNLSPLAPHFIAFLVEAAKWSILLTIALWLTLAQLAASRHSKKTHTA